VTNLWVRYVENRQGCRPTRLSIEARYMLNTWGAAGNIGKKTRVGHQTSGQKISPEEGQVNEEGGGRFLGSKKLEKTRPSHRIVQERPDWAGTNPGTSAAQGKRGKNSFAWENFSWGRPLCAIPRRDMLNPSRIVPNGQEKGGEGTSKGVFLSQEI